jgi:hypothetical protein
LGGFGDPCRPGLRLGLDCGTALPCIPSTPDDVSGSAPATAAQLEVDARAATAAGLRGIWLNRTGDAVPPGVEAIDNLTDLPSRLAGLRLI